MQNRYPASVFTTQRPMPWDFVRLYAEEKKALVAEVKRQSKNFKPDLFALKVEELRKKVLFKYEIESRLFSMEDM